MKKVKFTVSVEETYEFEVVREMPDDFDLDACMPFDLESSLENEAKEMRDRFDDPLWANACVEDAEVVE